MVACFTRSSLLSFRAAISFLPQSFLSHHVQWTKRKTDNLQSRWLTECLKLVIRDRLFSLRKEKKTKNQKTIGIDSALCVLCRIRAFNTFESRLHISKEFENAIITGYLKFVNKKNKIFVPHENEKQGFSNSSGVEERFEKAMV